MDSLTGTTKMKKAVNATVMSSWMDMMVYNFQMKVCGTSLSS